MNSITEKLTANVEPKMAIIVYEGVGDYYLERRDIINGKMTAGVPLTEDCLSDISEVISHTSVKMIHGLIPSYMLYADPRPGNEKYIWYRKPEKRQMYFTKALNIPNGEIKLPGLVYMVEGKTLSVFAVKSKARVGMSTRLYSAPFFNVSNNAKVCMGNAKMKWPEELTYDRIIQYWEDKFWLSEFDHILGSNPIKGNLSTITKRCIKTGCDFPLDELKPLEKLTLKSLLK
jgi:PRTRC genetic system protein B